MGDRVSISFKKDGIESVALFNHWGGKGFADEALDYAERLKQRIGDSQVNPIDRLEPETVMVDFIRSLTADMDIVDSNYYLGKDEKSGDNSDNGHFVINLDTFKIEHKEGIGF